MLVPPCEEFEFFSDAGADEGFEGFCIKGFCGGFFVGGASMLRMPSLTVLPCLRAIAMASSSRRMTLEGMMLVLFFV